MDKIPIQILIKKLDKETNQTYFHFVTKLVPNIGNPRELVSQYIDKQKRKYYGDKDDVAIID